MVFEFSLREHEICVDFLKVSNARRCKFEVVRIYANSSIVFAHVICNIEVVRLCPSGLLLFPGNEDEWPMFCQNVDSFPFWQISGSRYVLVSSTSHAEIHGKFWHEAYVLPKC